jgi:limonene 1,2-monooxygenase
MQVSGGVGTIIGFVHDWANRRIPAAAGTGGATCPEINGYVEAARSQKFLIETARCSSARARP